MKKWNLRENKSKQFNVGRQKERNENMNKKKNERKEKV